MRTLQCLKKKFKLFFCPQKVEKTTLKSCSEFSNPLFFPDCLNGLDVHFRFIKNPMQPSVCWSGEMSQTKLMQTMSCTKLCTRLHCLESFSTCHFKTLFGFSPVSIELLSVSCSVLVSLLLFGCSVTVWQQTQSCLSSDC